MLFNLPYSLPRLWVTGDDSTPKLVNQSLSFMNQVLHVIFMPVLESYNNHLGVVLKALSYTQVRQIMRVKRHCDSSNALLGFRTRQRTKDISKCSETAFSENRYQILVIFFLLLCCLVQTVYLGKWTNDISRVISMDTNQHRSLQSD